MRLRTRYALVLVALLLVLGTVTGATTELFKQRTIEQERADLNQTTVLTADQVDKAVADRRNFVSWYATNLDPNDLENSSEQLDQMLSNSEFFAAELVNEDGVVVDLRGDIDDEQRQEFIGTNVSDLEYVQNALGGAEETIRPPQRHPSGGVVVHMSVPVIDDQNEPAGVLMASAFVSNTDFLSATQPLQTSTQTVRVVGTTEEGESVVLSEPRNQFENTLQTQTRLETTGWQIQVERDRSELTGRLQFLQFLQLGSLLIVVLAVGALGYYEYRTNLQQTERLLDGFTELTAGNYEYSLSLTAAEEWNQISDGFNEMSTGLKERETAIQERERRLSVLNRVLRHNLQNDMSVIQGYAEIIPVATSDDQLEQASEKILEKAQGLVDHGQKARKLEEVMDNAEDGPTDMDIARNIGDILSDYERDYPDYSIEAELPDSAWVSAVAGVEFGIESLIENAIVHNDSEDPEVRVGATGGDSMVHIEIADNGPGIPQHEREVLTQDEETSLEHGSGIGLFLTYWSVIKSEGELEFEDPEEGGAVVRVSLPATEPPDDTDTGAESGESEATEEEPSVGLEV